MTTVAVGHVVIDDRGNARIEGSRIKVIHLVMERMANGWSPEELQRQFAHLTLAQIYGAVAYYYAHQEELDAKIKESIELAKKMRAEAGESPLVKRLREAGKLP